MTADPVPLLAGVGFTDNRMRNQLPAANQPWPPVRFNPVNFDMRIWDAWWSGDPDKLMRAYYSLGANSPLGRQFFATTGEAGMPTPRPGQFRGGLLGSIRRFFWGQPTPPGEKRTNYHLPIAGDIAATSSNLLFAKPPSLTYDQDDPDAPGGPVQDWLEGVIDDSLHATLLEAAETCAALSGVFLRVVWDTDVAEHPWIDVVPPDAAVPEFAGNKLVAVTFWRVISDTGKEVVRHLEKHVPARNAILHGVYVGTQGELGMARPLGDFPETAPYAASVTDGNAITFPDQPFDASTVVYVPNMRPNRIWRDLGPQAAPLGRSDYAGIETMMDGLDETFSSLMRDIRLGKARLIVPQSMLDNIGRGKGATFEPDREIYSALQFLTSGEGGPAQNIMPQQPAIRDQEYTRTISATLEQIINMAGYSAQTFGMTGDVAQTATEVVARERKSLTTRAKKINYWRPALADIVYGLASIENSVFNRADIIPVRPKVDFGDVVLPDMLELAQTVQALRQAEAASVETAVATVHPDWTPEEVAAEVGRIYAEMDIDLLSRARVALSAPPSTESLGQQIGEIPGDIAASDVASQVKQVADASGEADQGE